MTRNATETAGHDDMERVLLVYVLMSNDHEDSEAPSIYEQGATEEQTEKIEAIVGSEVLGYDGSARGEHSGQDSGADTERLSDVLVNNRPDQIK